MEKIIFYIDGFNLYFGLKTKGWKSYYWLNLEKLAKNLLKQDQLLKKVKYFTSRITEPQPKAKRQSTFIETLETLSIIEFFFGKYQSNEIKCRVCGNVINKSSEKMTDVNISVEMLLDAFKNEFDTAILVSADSDLVGPVESIRKVFPNKKIIIAFPPSRKSNDLINVANGYFTIGRKKIKDSIFPDKVLKSDGHTLIKPSEWNH
jgi:uncharacterized LabA/DUF88 family protein